MDTLRQGMAGPDVLKWQIFLVGQGLMAEATTSTFDAPTLEATKKFQERHKLKADGIAGNKTIGQAQVLGFDVISDTGAQGDQSPDWPPLPDFKPLVGNDARAAIFGKFAYRHDPVPGNFENIKITDNWEQSNIVRLTLPQLAGVKGASATGAVRCHRLIATQLKQLWSEWQSAGLSPKVKTWAGMYVPRFIRGSTTVLSNHAFGTAFDINVAWNALGARPALAGTEGSVRELVSIAHKHGFYWGGHFLISTGRHAFRSSEDHALDSQKAAPCQAMSSLSRRWCSSSSQLFPEGAGT